MKTECETIPGFDSANVDWSVGWSTQAELIAPGLHRWPLPLPLDGLRAVNVYAYLHANGAVTLIDAGWDSPESRRALIGHLTRVGRHLEDITEIVVTHIHDDHFGQAAALQRELGVITHLGAGEQAALDTMLAAYVTGEEVLDVALLKEAGALQEFAEMLRERRRTGMFRGGRLQAPTHWINDADQIRVANMRLRAIATPGHTRGHVVFADDARNVLFAGDHVLPHITPSIGFEAGGSVRPLVAFMKSLERVLGIPDYRLLPAHGRADQTVHARALSLLSHHETRLEMILDAVPTSGDRALVIARRIGWGSRGQRSFEELDELNRYLALSETVAHLDTLVELGDLSTSEKAKGRMFAPTTPASQRCLDHYRARVAALPA